MSSEEKSSGPTGTARVQQPHSGLFMKKSRTYKLRDVSLKKREEMEIRKSQQPTPRKRGPKPRPKSGYTTIFFETSLIVLIVVINY